MDELMILARLEHRNVVKLKGFCNNDGWFPFGRSGRGLYVCNEFFSHGSLDEHIFGMLASISCYALLMYLSDFHNNSLSSKMYVFLAFLDIIMHVDIIYV